MGANTFSDVVIAKNAQEAFRQAVEEAQYDHGHAGYTGTIAEKHDFRMISCPAGVEPSEFAHDAINYGLGDDEEKSPHDVALRIAHDIVDDKWGPAGCIDVTDTEEGKKILEAWAIRQNSTGTFVNGVRQGDPVTTEGKRVFLFFGWASS